jgi:predicted Rdx family selenoprotein
MPMDATSSLCTTYCTRGWSKTITNKTQFGQELLSTFGTQIGEIALIPATGGLFTVELVSHHRHWVVVTILVRA